MENDDVPDWAIERVIAKFRQHHPATGWSVEEIRCSNASNAGFREIAMDLARYIAQHEKPPVDPDLMLAREIAALVADEWGLLNGDAVNLYREGVYDNDDEMKGILKLLKERKG